MAAFHSKEAKNIIISENELVLVDCIMENVQFYLNFISNCPVCPSHLSPYYRVDKENHIYNWWSKYAVFNIQQQWLIQKVGTLCIIFC